MENKGIRTFWYSIAVAFSLTGVFSDKPNIFISIGFFIIIVGNMHSRQL